jgi:ribA/ribD-fused uncharacterized protein
MSLLEELKSMITNLSLSQKREFNQLHNELKDLQSSLEFSQAEIKDLQSSSISMKADITTLQQENQGLKDQLQESAKHIEVLEDKVDYMENYSRRDNLKFGGISESKGENCEEVLKLFLTNVLKITGDIVFERVHRIGSADSNRDIIARFHQYNDRRKVWEKRKELQGTKFTIREDFSSRLLKCRSLLYPYLNAAILAGKKASYRYDKLCIEGKTYSLSQIDGNFPFKPQHTIMSDEHTFFHGRLSPFSNFYSVSLDIDNSHYNCVEQFFQTEFVTFHGNLSAARKIMESSDPSEQKRIAKMAVRTPKESWGAKSVEVMTKALEHKFNPVSNKDLCTKLCETAPKRLVECNRHDNFWAIGLSLNNDDKDDPSKWEGQNKLGELLTSIRDTLSGSG